MQLSYPQNRRLHRRIPIAGLVRFESSERSYSGYLVNVSKGGLMLKTRELPRPDEEITLSFQLLPSSYGYNLRAIVVWVSPKIDPEIPRGMGVRFVDPGRQDEKQIEDYIEEFEPEGSS